MDTILCTREQAFYFVTAWILSFWVVMTTVCCWGAVSFTLSDPNWALCTCWQRWESSVLLQCLWKKKYEGKYKISNWKLCASFEVFTVGWMRIEDWGFWYSGCDGIVLCESTLEAEGAMFFRTLGTTFPVTASHTRRLESMKTVSLPIKLLSSVQNSSLVDVDKGYTVTVNSECAMWNFFFDFIILILLSRYCTFSYLNVQDMFIWNKFTELVNNNKKLHCWRSPITRYPMFFFFTQ